mmetsp:Transcript_26489/g.58052  ORF Transcript_26489/g.58052 Transcript_26489/m.58052 type:complete len:334 (-) Transcript_26489:123-1124(-)
MDYRRYPYDEQVFNFTLSATTANFAHEVAFKSTVEATIEPQNRHAVWKVEAVNTVDGKRRFAPDYGPETFRRVLEITNGESPIFNFLSVAPLDSDDSMVAYSEFVMRVSRYSSYYLGNYIFLEVILVLLGWVTFFMSPESVDARVGISLTLVLAINVFQIVLVENIPETGYLTDLAIFTVCNTVILALTCIETVIVFAAVKTTRAKDAIVSATKLYANSPAAVAACCKIQRAVRRRLYGCNGHVVLNSKNDNADDTKRQAYIHSKWKRVIAERKMQRSHRLRLSRRQARSARIVILKTYQQHARYIATEGDRISAIFIFPIIFTVYTATIFGR